MSAKNLVWLTEVPVAERETHWQRRLMWTIVTRTSRKCIISYLMKHCKDTMKSRRGQTAVLPITTRRYGV